MPAAIYTLAYGATEKTLAAWGIANPRCEFRSFAPDTLSFQIPLTDAFAVPAFPYGAALILKKDGVTWFSGTVTQEQASARRSREEHGYIVSGPWWQLQRCVYQQLRCVKSGDFSTVSSEFSSRVILGQSDVGLRLTTTEEISRILAYALTKGVSLTAGSITGGIAFPYQEGRDITCAEAIQRMARRTPDMVSWFDYSTTTPTLNFARRSTLAGVSLDATAANLQEELNVISRADLVPPGVRFIFVTSAQNTGGDEIIYTRLTTQEAGSPDALGGIIATIEPMGEGSDRPEQIPASLATNYLAALATIPYQGSLRTHALDCAGTLRPGKKLNLTNGRTVWATMDALIQGVTEDLFAGTTEIEFGPPEQLGPQDFIEQLIFNRQAPFNTSFYRVRNCLNTTGKEEGDNPSGGDTTTTNTKAAVAPGSAASRSDDVFNQLKSDHSMTVSVCDPDTGLESEICVIGSPGACV